MNGLCFFEPTVVWSHPAVLIFGKDEDIITVFISEALGLAGELIFIAILLEFCIFI